MEQDLKPITNTKIWQLRLHIRQHASLPQNNISRFPILLSIRRLIVLAYGNLRSESEHFIDLAAMPALEYLQVHALDEEIFPRFFRGRPRKLRRVALAGPVSFKRATDFTDLLRAVGGPQLKALSVFGARFLYEFSNSAMRRNSNCNHLNSVHTLEILHTDPKYFGEIPFHELRQAAIDAIGGDGDFASTLLSITQYATKLETLVLRGHAASPDIRISPSFVDQMMRWLHLQHFQLIGSLFFARDDWDVLCRRLFPQMNCVHIENDGRNAIPGYLSAMLSGSRIFVVQDDTCGSFVIANAGARCWTNVEALSAEEMRARFMEQLKERTAFHSHVARLTVILSRQSRHEQQNLGRVKSSVFSQLLRDVTITRQG